jgi:hypothetical protein
VNKKSLWMIPAMLLFSVAAYAGLAQPAPVTITLHEGGGSAQGDMSTARHADNDFELIGCGVRVFETGVDNETFTWAFCQASVAEEATTTCFTENPNLLEGINIISDHSYVTFSWEDDGEGNLTCTRIGSSTQSFYLPFNKDAKK